MSSVSETVGHSEASGDLFDRCLAVAWVASDIAVNAFGVFFWTAIVLFYFRAIA